MGWIVGRGDGGCYVEEGNPRNGEISFPTEREAVEYAILCDEAMIEPIRYALKIHRQRLRNLKRRLNPTAAEGGDRH